MPQARVNLTLALTPEEYAEVDAFARSYGISKQNLLLDAWREMKRNHDLTTATDEEFERLMGRNRPQRPA